MDKKILVAYEKLVPVDQLVIDAIILALYKKDKTNNELTKRILEYHDKKKENK